MTPNLERAAEVRGRFIPFVHGTNRLQMNRVYLTDKGKEIGPFDEKTWFKEDKEFGGDVETFDLKVGNEFACWWDTGVTANELAEELGEITAVEIDAQAFREKWERG